MNRSTRNTLSIILAVSVLLRLGVALYLGDTVPLAKDEYSYATLAERLATGHGFSFPLPWYPFTAADTPTSHWSFLYTAFVAGVYAVAGPHPLAARLVQAVIAGLLMPWLTYRLTRRMTGRFRQATGSAAVSVPLIAAGLAAIYAYFVLYGAMVQTEAFFICALLWSLERAMALERIFDVGVSPSSSPAGSSRGFWTTALGLGFSLGTATLLRQSILPWVVVLFGYLLWKGWRGAQSGARRGLVRVLAGLFLVGVVLVACIVPVTLRNYRVYGQFLLLNSNAGYAMYSAQHPVHGTSFQEYAAAPLPAELLDRGLNEAEWDRELMRRGIAFALAEPGRYLLLSLSRLRDYFQFWPTADSSTVFNLGRVLSIGVFLPFMLWGLVLSVRNCGARLALLYLFMFFYSTLHIFTWAMSRYRLPVDAVALPFAALAILTLAHGRAERIYAGLRIPALLSSRTADSSAPTPQPLGEKTSAHGGGLR